MSGHTMDTVLRAEWTTLRTASGMCWLLLAVIVLTVAGGAAATAAKLSLTGTDLGQTVVAILAVLAVRGTRP